MGLFNSADGELLVQFYDDPRQTLQDGLVSVTYTFRDGDIDRVARDFGQYVAKVVYCLGPGGPAMRLQAILGVVLANGLTKSTNVLQGDGYSMAWTKQQYGATKKCHAKFYANRPPVTKFSIGGEEYYAPMSCLAFLQHLVDNLSDSDLARVSQALGT